MVHGPICCITRRCVSIGLFLGLLSAAPADAAPWRGGLLYQRFGVTLDIEEYSFAADRTVYRFSNSWEPARAPQGYTDIDYIVNDYYAWPSNGAVISSEPANHGGHVVNDPSYTTPTWSAGGEPYDVEAIYMTNDDVMVYIAIVTSVPPPPGRSEAAAALKWVVTGDLAIHTPGSDYDYGVDINLADRGKDQLVAAPLPTTVGAGLYDTSPGQWYTTNAKNAVTAVTSPSTNFYGAGMSGSKIGDVSVQYLNTELREGYDVSLPTGDYSQLSTWEIDICIPISLLPAYADMEHGEERDFGISFIPGCRNDGNASRIALRLDGEVSVAPEPGTWALLTIGLVCLALWRRRQVTAPVPVQASSTSSGGQLDR